MFTKIIWIFSHLNAILIKSIIIAFKDINMQQEKKRLYTTTVVLSVMLIIVSRASAYLCSVSATDIAYPKLVYDILSYLTEITSCARVVLGYAAITYCVYRFGKSETYASVGISVIAALIDYLARFAIDAVNGALSGIAAFSLIWLFIQFLYESVFIALALLSAIFMKKKRDASSTSIQAAKYSETRALSFSALLVMLSKIALEVIYLYDFLTTYSNITNTEIASIVGQFLRIAVIYGAIALLFCEIFIGILSHNVSKERIAK